MHIHFKRPTLQSLHLKEIVTEAVIIVFAVLAALVGEGWWDHRKTMADVKVAQERINAEILDNYLTLLHHAHVTERNLTHLLALEASLPAGTAFITASQKFDGFKTVSLQSAAWQRAIRDRLANEMPPDYIEQAYRVYVYNDRFDMLEQKVLDLVFSETFVADSKSLEGYRIASVYYRQNKNFTGLALEEYETFLRRYFPAGELERQKGRAQAALQKMDQEEAVKKAGGIK